MLPFRSAARRGSLADPSGKPAATILPTADTGLISNSGTFFPEAVIPLVWTADNTSAYLNVQGVGCVLLLPSSGVSSH